MTGRYNPNKITNQFNRTSAERCLLFRWESIRDQGWKFAARSSESPEFVNRVAAYMLHTPLPWVVMVHACYVAGPGDYYERADIYLDDAKLAKADSRRTLAFLEKIDATVAEVSGRGNAAHLIDTVVMLKIHTDKLESRLDDDDWMKGQADFRATAILEEWERRQEALRND